MTRTEASVFFQKYALAFDNFDAEAMTKYFDIPSLIVTVDGSAAFTSKQQLQANCEKINANHKSIGYHHADLISCDLVNEVGGFFSTVNARWNFLREDGTLLFDFDMQYLLRKTATGWKISSAIHHS